MAPERRQTEQQEITPFGVEEVVFLGNRGPCGGVNMAIEVAHEVLSAVDGREPVYTTNPIVHYREVVQTFEDMGLTQVPSVDYIPRGSIVLLSAHGNTPGDKETLANNDCVTVDTTCQLVRKVQNMARGTIRNGGVVPYFGSYRSNGEMHPETRSIMGHAQDEIEKLKAQGQEVVGSIKLILGPEDIDEMELGVGQRATVLTQTTMSTFETAEIQRRAQEKFGDRIDGKTWRSICLATDNRQNALMHFAPDADAIIVVGDVTGDKPSHNTTMLAEIGAQIRPTHAIGSELQLDSIDFGDARRIIMTSGASVPDDAAPLRVLNWFKARGANIVYGKPLVDEKTAAFTKPEKDLQNLHAALNRRYGDSPAN